MTNGAGDTSGDVKGLTVDVVYKRFGLTPNALRGLVGAGVLPPTTVFSESDILALREGEDYVVCRECNRWTTEITANHLRACSGMSRAEYLAKHTGAPWRSDLVRGRKAKTPEQKAAQSRKLKDRFQTPEGEKTRQEIAEAARRMQAGGYGARAAAHLRELNSRPDQKARRSAESKARWASGEQRAVIQAWLAAHPDQVLASAAHARRHIRKHFTKLHETVKVGLAASGLDEFITEHEVGFYSIDEAMPGIRLAVEVDGCWWHGCQVCGHPGVGAIRSCDARKTSYLTNRGWTIIRLAEHDIKADIDGCVSVVRGTVERLCEERRVA